MGGGGVKDLCYQYYISPLKHNRIALNFPVSYSTSEYETVNLNKNRAYESKTNLRLIVASQPAVAMFTLYRTVKRSVAETVPDKASVHTRNATFRTISAPEQDYFAPFSKDVIPAMQRSSFSCSHCTGSVFATLRFTIRYRMNIACIDVNLCGIHRILVSFISSVIGAEKIYYWI